MQSRFDGSFAIYSRLSPLRPLFCFNRFTGTASRHESYLIATPSSYSDSMQDGQERITKERRGPRSPKEQWEARAKKRGQQRWPSKREHGDLQKERDILTIPESAIGKKWHLNQLLTTWIMKTKSITELAELLDKEENLERANASNLIAALTQISWLYKAHRLGKPPSNQDDQEQSRTVFDDYTVRKKAYALAGSLTDRLMTRWRGEGTSESQFDEVNVPQGWIQVASAFARLGPFDDPDRIGAFFPQLLGSLPDYSQPRHYAEACWSIAKLGRDPGPRWIEAMLVRQCWLVYFLFSLPISRLSLPLFSFLKVQSRLILHQFNLTELSNMIWSLAKWG